MILRTNCDDKPVYSNQYPLHRAQISSHLQRLSDTRRGLRVHPKTATMLLQATDTHTPLQVLQDKSEAETQNEDH